MKLFSVAAALLASGVLNIILISVLCKMSRRKDLLFGGTVHLCSVFVLLWCRNRPNSLSNQHIENWQLPTGTVFLQDAASSRVSLNIPVRVRWAQKLFPSLTWTVTDAGGETDRHVYHVYIFYRTRNVIRCSMLLWTLRGDKVRAGDRGEQRRRPFTLELHSQTNSDESAQNIFDILPLSALLMFLFVFCMFCKVRLQWLSRKSQ